MRDLVRKKSFLIFLSGSQETSTIVQIILKKKKL